MKTYTTTMPLGSMFKDGRHICVTVNFDDEAILKVALVWQGTLQSQPRYCVDQRGGATAVSVDNFMEKHPAVHRWIKRYGTPYATAQAQEAMPLSDPSQTSNHYVAQEVEVDKVVAGIIQGGLNKGLFTPNAARVYTVLSSIPPPFLVSYGTLALFAGMAKASRAVGTMMRNNPFPAIIPCHRVIPAEITPKLVPVGMVVRGAWSFTYIIGDPNGDTPEGSKGKDIPDASLGGYLPGAEMKRFLIDARV